MVSDHGRETRLTNDTVVNVAALLREPVGSTRDYALHLDAFPLDDEAVAMPVDGYVKLTRLRDSVMVAMRAHGNVDMECARCLRTYTQGFDTEFSEQFRQTVDLRTGVSLDNDAAFDDDAFTISENHELDFGELLRQEILVALPMRPDCGAACPGPDLTEAGEAGNVDERLAALSRLLEDENTTSS